MEKDKPTDETTWNNTHKRDAGQRLNEGFSGENIPGNYDPSGEKMDAQLRTERETDKQGNTDQVRRARYTGDNAKAASARAHDEDNAEIRPHHEGRDQNYDDQRRYKGNLENRENRGNFDVNED
jgi:hypothetical protein